MPSIATSGLLSTPEANEYPGFGDYDDHDDIFNDDDDADNLLLDGGHDP